MSDASRHQLYVTAEVTAGTTPATPAWSPVPNTGTTIGVTKGANQSATLKANRQIPFFRHGTEQVGGDISFELGYGHHDDLLAAALGGTWAPKSTITGTTISAAAADNSYNDSGDGFVDAGFEVGDPVAVTGFTGDLANNITYGILTAVAAGKLTIGGTDGDVIVDEIAGDSVTIVNLAQVVVAGTTRQSFSLMRYFSDLDGADKPYHVFNGVELNNFSVTVTPDAIVTGSFSVLGRGYDAPAETAPTGSTYNSDPTTEPFDAFTGGVDEGGTPIAIATELSLALENGLGARFAIGSKFSRQPSIGRSNISGSATFYFEDSTLIEKFYDETESTFKFDLIDPDGNKLIFEVLKLKYTGGQADVSGEADVPLSMPFQGYEDPTTGTNFKVTRVPASA